MQYYPVSIFKSLLPIPSDHWGSKQKLDKMRCDSADYSLIVML